MEKCDYAEPWYQGSPETLSVLRKGSWVTQCKEMAKAFSHRPSLLSFVDDANNVKHDGQRPGYLYMVSESLGPDDVSYLRDTCQTHWQTQRVLQVELVADLPLDDPPQLSEQEIAELRQELPKGTTGFIGTPDEKPPEGGAAAG